MAILEMPMTILDRRPSDQPELFSRRVRSARRFYLNLAPPKEASLAVVCGGYEECADDYVVRRRHFPHHVVEWVVGGRGRFRCGSADWIDLKGGDLFAYGPRMAHEIESDAKRPLSKHFVCFAGLDALALLQSARLEPGSVIAMPTGAETPRAFETLLGDGVRNDAAADDLCAVQLRYLLLKIGASDRHAKSADASAHATYVRCDRYLRANAGRLRSLTQVARECGVSEEYLCRLYKRFGQQTPYQRLTRLRMSAAAERLACESTPIKRVAADLGYDDPFHFSRCFKRTLGLSPSEFRHLHSVRPARSVPASTLTLENRVADC